MKGHCLAAALAGLIVGGLATAFLTSRPAAHAQEKERKTVWEYKVVFAGSQSKESAPDMTAQFNSLAKDGWEYVGPVVDRTRVEQVAATPVGIAGSYVLFRRPKT